MVACLSPVERKQYVTFPFSSMVEQRTFNPLVTGSNPVGGTMVGMNDINRIMAESYLPAYERELAHLKKTGPRLWGDKQLQAIQRETHELEIANLEWFIRKCKETLGRTND